MLEIHVPRKFEAERSYIVDVLFNDFLGLKYQLVIDNTNKDYEIVLRNGSSIIVEDHFFNRFPDGLEYLREENIPKTVKFVKQDFGPEADLPIIFGRIDLHKADHSSRPILICGIDIFASSFFMLTRWEEYVDKTRDEHNRFPATASLGFKNNFLHRAVVNEYSEMLWNMLEYMGISQKRRDRRFELVLTHDVDMPFFWKGWTQIGRFVGGDLLKRRSFRMAADNLWQFFSVKAGRCRDPFDTFDELMDYSEMAGVRSNFFFMGGGKTQWDSSYDLRSSFIQRLLDKIHRRNHVIGFHPSYLTYNRSDLWKKEFIAVSNAFPEPLIIGRQHYLRFEVPTTWQIWEDNQMDEDMSLCYADHEGFRCGICWSFPVFNILTRKRLHLRERPLIVADGILANYRKYDPVEMTNKICHLKDTTRKYKGEFVLLWHNSSFYGDDWEKYDKVYYNVFGQDKSDCLKNNELLRKGD